MEVQTDDMVSMMNCPDIDEVPTHEEHINKPPSVETASEPDESDGVLPADHPLLAKFQKSLNEHLRRVHAQLSDEIQSLDYKIEAKEKQRENVGSRLYDMQQEISRQNQLLEEYTSQIDEITEKRITKEKELIPIKKDFTEKLAKTKEMKHHHNERLMEMTRLQTLENNIDLWATDMTDEVTLAKRIVSKDHQDQQLLSTMKKKTDFVIHHLDMSVRKAEQELKGIESQIKDQDQIMNVVLASYCDATADLEALQQEHTKLTRAWSEVIISIQHRDKILHETRTQLAQQKEEFKLTAASINGTQRAAAKEMEQNERLEAFKTRIAEDLNNLNNQTDKQQEILEKLQDKHEQFTTILERSEKDFTEAKQEGNALEVQLRRIQTQLDKQCVRKLKLEEEILALAQNQLTTDKASEYRLKILHQSQEQRRNLEMALSHSEKSVSQILLDLEKWKEIVIRLKEEEERLTKIYNEINDKADEKSRTLKNIEDAISKKMKDTQKLCNKLEGFLRDSDGHEGNQTSLKIQDLERGKEKNESEIRNLQEFWLILQGHVVNLTEKRTAQMYEMQIARKQLMILNQKSLRVDTDLRNTENAGLDILKTIKLLSSKLELLGNKLFEKKKSHQSDETECEMLHLDLIDRLKTSELSVLKVEQEIVDINAEIADFKEMVLDKHREALSWETKYKLIEDTIRWRRDERSMEGEISNMKSEIHRMEVRHNQLKRAQEKLVQDLEYCVLHRGKIFDLAMIQKKVEGNQSKSRSTIQLKLKEVKSKYKAAQVEVVNVERKLHELNGQIHYVETDICTKQDCLVNERAADMLIMNEIEEGMLLKHQNLENIVRKQHRAKHYRCLSCTTIQPKHTRNENYLDTTLERQKEVNDYLTEITQQILNEYPNKKFFLTRILNTLKEE